MKRIKEIKGFKYIYLYKNSIIVRNEGCIQQISDIELKPLIEGNIYAVNIINGTLFYQLDDSSNIHALDRHDLKEPHIGVWGVLSAIKYKDYIYIYSNFENEDAYYLLDENLNVFKKIKAKCNYSYAENLLRTGLNNVICYNMNEKLWHYKHTDDSYTKIISGYKDKILIYSESGDLFALDLQTGNLSWKYPEQCPYGRYGFFDNCIYHMYKDEFREILADTGELLRIGDISDLRQKGNYFAANAGIKVYKDYIFCRDTMGAVAIIDRETLDIKEVLHFDKHLINSENTLQWVNYRLYVQDVEYTIHIFE